MRSLWSRSHRVAGVVVLLVGTFLLVLAHPATACTVCYGAADSGSPLIDGARLGIFLLLGVTGTVLGAFARFFFYLRKRARQAENDQITSEWAQLQRLFDMMERWLPPNAAAHGAQIDSALNWVHWLMALLFVGWIAFFVIALWRFRRSRNPVASHAGATGKTSTWIEISVAVAEVILLVGIAIPLWADRVERFPPEKDATVVRLVGEQFAWNIHYPGPDGIFGRTSIDKIDLQSNPLGLDRSDPAAKDDVTTVNQLYLPVGKPAIVHLSSKDVIHSFNVPEFRIKQDAVPGIDIPVWWVPTITTVQMRQKLNKPEFVYEIACAQLCGIGHSSMRGFVTIQEPAEFQKWMDEQVAAAAESGGEDDIWN